MMNWIFLKEMCRIGYLIQIRILRNTKSTKNMSKTLVTVKPTEICFTCWNNATDFFRKNRKIFPLQSVRTGMTNQYCGPERLIPFTFWRNCLWKKNSKNLGLLRLRPGLWNFFGNRNLLERSDDKVPAEVLKLVSTFIEWHHIFYDCDKCLHLCECPALQRQASTNTQTLWFMYREKKNENWPQNTCFARFTSAEIWTKKFNTKSVWWVRQPKLGEKSHNFCKNRGSIFFCPQEFQ